MTEWQPIETAPKDGTPIVLYAGRYGALGMGICCGAWRWNQWRIYGVANGPPSSGKKKETQWLDEVAPTHWRPLPPPPGEAPAPSRDLIPAAEVTPLVEKLRCRAGDYLFPDEWETGAQFAFNNAADELAALIGEAEK